jgi:hypothetical protein
MAASSNKHPEFHYYSTKSDDFGVKLYVFRVKEFIEMVNKVVEGLIDSKIQDGHHCKEIQQNSLNIHTRAIIVDVWCLMLCFQAQRIHSNDQLGCREKWQK